MKILHFHPDGVMARRFVRPLMEEELKRGYETSLIVSRSGDDSCFKQIRYDLSFENLAYLLPSLIRIIWIICVYRPDFIFSHNTKSSFLPLLAGWFARVKVRVYFNHGVPYAGYKGALRWVLIFLERINCGLSNEVVTVSDDMADLIRAVAVKAQPRLIYNGSACGIDLSKCDFSGHPSSFDAVGHRFDEEDIIVAYVGRPEKRKGFVHALSLWDENTLDPRFKLILCGPNEDDVAAVMPKIPQNVICLGFVDNVTEILWHADILILPSLHEGLSYAVLEAMACGCIVIVNDVPGLSCIVKDRVNGYLVEGNSTDLYADLINGFDKESITIKNMKHQAFLTANLYKREDFMRKYVDFLSNLTG